MTWVKIFSLVKAGREEVERSLFSDGREMSPLPSKSRESQYKMYCEGIFDSAAEREVGDGWMR